MEDKLAQEYRQIFELRKWRRASGERSYQLDELAGNIQHELTGRMTYGQAAAAFAAVSVLFGLSMAPVLFFRIRLGRGSVLLTLLAAAGRNCGFCRCTDALSHIAEIKASVRGQRVSFLSEWCSEYRVERRAAVFRLHG